MIAAPVRDPRSARVFPAFIRAAAAAHGDATAIVLRGESGTEDAISFAQLDERSAALARGLVARGVGKGTRIGFICGNGPFFALAFAAIARIGAVAIPISTLVRADELVRILRQSDVAGLIVQRTLLGHDHVDRLCEALPALRECADPDLRIDAAPYLRWIVSTGDALPPAIQGIDGLDRAAATVSDALLRAIEAEVHPVDQMIEIYTSGSMALPKGVRHDHGPVLFRTDYLCSIAPVAAGQEVWARLPMFWVGGLMMSLLPNLAIGATTVCTERTATNSRVAMGSVLAPEDMALLAQARPYWALGMTETLGPYGHGDALRVAGYPLCAPIDHVADGFEVRVADADGRPVADGATGEIQVRGYAVTPGLHKVERDAGFTSDGFYRTGDMGRVDGRRIHFLGRDGDVIKTVGSNVSPAEVEMEMQRLDGVHSAYVVGVSDAERGQMVVAAVVPREGCDLDFDAIRDALHRRLSSYKVPRAYVAITRDEVPMLPSQKVARRRIATMVAARLGRS